MPPFFYVRTRAYTPHTMHKINPNLESLFPRYQASNPSNNFTKFYQCDKCFCVFQTRTPMCILVCCNCVYSKINCIFILTIYTAVSVYRKWSCATVSGYRIWIPPNRSQMVLNDEQLSKCCKNTNYTAKTSTTKMELEIQIVRLLC